MIDYSVFCWKEGLLQTMCFDNMRHNVFLFLLDGAGGATSKAVVGVVMVLVVTMAVGAGMAFVGWRWWWCGGDDVLRLLK